jgi:hypothetical protein
MLEYIDETGKKHMLPDVVTCEKCWAAMLPDDVVKTGFSFVVEGFGEYDWDIAMAKRIVSNVPHEAVVLLPEELAGLASNNGIDEEHVMHVDVDIPGIMAQAWDPSQNCPAVVLIDGSHRAVKALITGVEFRVCVLSDQESNQCLKRQPVLAPEQQERMRRMEAMRGLVDLPCDTF